MKRIIPILFILLCLSINGYAQKDRDEIQNSVLNQSDVLEELVDESEEGNFEDNTVYEHLQYFISHPINLNKASYEEFRELGLLDDLSIKAILDYRIKYGDFISISELQAIKLLNEESIRKIIPFVKVSAGADDLQSSILSMMKEGKNEMFLRGSRTLPDKKGFLITDTTKTRYLGDPNQFYLRFKHSFERHLSYGFTAEKDSGEEFFIGSNKQGFDYYSFHFYLKNYRKWLKGIAIGDYTINLGQGLIHFDGFATGKSSFTTMTKRSGQRMKAFTSVNEAIYLRGGAAEFHLAKDLDLLLFASSRKIDANINQSDTIDIDDEALQFTSIQKSGLHRTQSEIDDKGSTIKTTLGSSFGINNRNWSINLNAVYDKLGNSALPSSKLYQRFNFTGNSLFNLSVDYSYMWRNFHFYGETARSDNGAIATINGLNFTPDRDFDIALVYRNFARDYHNLSSAVFSETRKAQNERGLYLGLEYRFSRELKVNAYVDQWSHPWLRFGVDGPSKGSEQYVRITYYKKRKYTFYIQAKNELKQKNLPTALETQPYDVLAWQRKAQFRLHFQHKISKTLELRNRAEISYYDIGGQKISRGYLVYQDIIYKPKDFPLSFSARYALFDTDDYNSRIYAFENDVLYYFSIPPYFYKGSRFYINLRYRPANAFTFELRYANTTYSNRDQISSGLNLIDSNSKHDLRAQIKFKF